MNQSENCDKHLEDIDSLSEKNKREHQRRKLENAYAYMLFPLSLQVYLSGKSPTIMQIKKKCCSTSFPLCRHDSMNAIYYFVLFFMSKPKIVLKRN